jgi:hypothetical protein
MLPPLRLDEVRVRPQRHGRHAGGPGRIAQRWRMAVDLAAVRKWVAQQKAQEAARQQRLRAYLAAKQSEAERIVQARWERERAQERARREAEKAQEERWRQERERSARRASSRTQPTTSACTLPIVISASRTDTTAASVVLSTFRIGKLPARHGGCRRVWSKGSRRRRSTCATGIRSPAGAWVPPYVPGGPWPWGADNIKAAAPTHEELGGSR